MHLRITIFPTYLVFFHLSFPYQTNDGIGQLDETIDIVFHAVLPHTSREVNIPYIHLKKRGPHNSRNH
ncbi:hypothetical protein V1477_001546 [Vespula maculifrons]|uniref:Secreted protein n=1 Tax=Vespula maculifrons TaxID=7453 RepID=A0ABD2CYR7_VESMC